MKQKESLLLQQKKEYVCNENSKDSNDDNLDITEESIVSIYTNPIFNNNGNGSNSQSSQHQLPKWVVQLLKDVRPNEKNKTGTRGSTRNEGTFSFITNDFTEPCTYREAVKH